METITFSEWRRGSLRCASLILVFGKNGQVGRELQALEGTVCFDRTQADFNEPDLCVSLIESCKPTAVVNAAAYTAVDQAEIDEEIATRINGYTPFEISKVCAAHGIPFLHISTDYVFDGSGTTPWTPNDNTNPMNAYGRTKLLGENLIRNSGAIFAILRTSWVVSGSGSNFLKTMLQRSRGRKTFDVVVDQVGGPTPARDIAFACLEIVKQLRLNHEKSGVYHFTGFPDVSWYEFANTIFELVGRDAAVKPILTSEYQTLAKRPLNSRLDCNSTAATFGICRPDWKCGVSCILRDLETGDEKT